MTSTRTGLRIDFPVKRRNFLRCSASAALVIISGLSAASEPCPPPALHVEGGDSVSTNCATRTGDHAYFESLVVHPSAWDSADLRTQGSIDGWADKNEGGLYDAAEDAMRQWALQGDASMNQMRHFFPSELPASAAGDLFVTWDTKFQRGWAQGGAIDGSLETYKAYQFSELSGGTHGGLHMELRFKFDAAPAGRVAELDVRPYEDSPTGDPKYGSGSMAQRVGTFAVSEDRWTRFFVHFDFDANTFTYWVADEQTPPTLLYDRVSYTNSAGILAFWFEFNSSQSRSGPERSIYSRNWVALRNTGGYNEAVKLVQQSVW